MQADDHPLALHRQVAYPAKVAGVHTRRYDTALRARAPRHSARELDAVPAREALNPNTHEQVFVGEEADEASGAAMHYKYHVV